MSYTLKGRLESRLATAVLPLAVAAALAGGLRHWWPLELATLMLGVGLALDLLYDRLLPYQPGWAALPLGALELAGTMAAARAAGVAAPLGPAVAFFACSWLLAQTLGHAGFPLLRLSYAEDGGELGRLAGAAGVAAAAVLAGAGGVAWATRPPTYRLEAGVQRGPLVLDHAQTLVGRPGAVVRGGIVVTADHVTVRDVAVEGGDYGIDVDDANDVLLDGVSIRGARIDGIHVRRSQVTIRDCTVRTPPGAFGQGIDVSFAMTSGHSVVEDCTVAGGSEGIVTHFAGVTVRDNRVSGTSNHGIALTEMSMGEARDNDVSSARGVGIFCGDHSMCELEGNVVEGASGPLGYAVVAQYGSEATLRDNELRGPRRVQASPDSLVVAR